MSPRKMWVAWPLGIFLLGAAGSVYAEGLVQKAGKNAAKGAVKGAAEAVDTGEVTRGAKQVVKSVLDGAADAVPMVTSQIVNQANVNKKTIGKVARQVTTEAVAGALGASLAEMHQALGAHGDGPLADTLAATTERIAAAFVRGASSEMHLRANDSLESETEKITAAAVRGAASEMHFKFSVWPLVLAFIGGAISTLLCGFGLMFLYLLFQKKRSVDVEVKTPSHPGPAAGMG